ncbi:MAG: sugar ABC transporter ATP-binding protein [Vicinamibacterales bacterium]
MAEALTTAPRLEMRGVRKAFGATIAVDGVDFAVAGGEVCALVGQNGAGKSTLMAILSGAIRADAGTMLLEGRPYAPRQPRDAREAGVAMIHQELSLAPHLSVMENIALGIEPAARGVIRWREMRETAISALAQLGHTEIRPDSIVANLSPAAQQLIEVARALATGSRVVVLDEPTSSLSHDDVRRLFGLIRRLRDQGMAIVYISHFIEEVKAVSDRVVVLRDGRNAGGGRTAEMSTEAIVRLMVGRKVDDLYPHSRRERGEVVLELTDVQPGAATLSVRRGEILGIAGLLGAGRTRLLRTIFGLESVRSGRIRVGVHAGPASPAARWDQGVGMLSENRATEGLAPGLSIADNLTMTRLTDLGPAFLVMPSRQMQAANRWIERFGIRSAGPRQAVAELSGGNQQKVALARLLHHDVDLLVLDEPTRGIDVGSKEQIYVLLDRLASGQGDATRSRQGPSTSAGQARPRAVLMVSSYLPELLGLCDRVAVMCRGRLGPVRLTSEWTEHSLLMEASGAQAV